MVRKRKRRDHGSMDTKRRKVIASTDGSSEAVDHPTLSLYYSQARTLRSYLLSRIPSEPRSRRRRLALAGSTRSPSQNCSNSGSSIGQATNPEESNALQAGSNDLKHILDHILVCDNAVPSAHTEHYTAKDLEIYSQQVSILTGGTTQSLTSPSDLVDFVVWLLFNRIHRNVHRPPHLLCHGFQRASIPKSTAEDNFVAAGIPGIVPHYPNENINFMKGAAWSKVLNLLGRGGDKVVLDMLLTCSLFVAPNSGDGNLIQISGVPLTDVKPRNRHHEEQPQSNSAKTMKYKEATAAAINFVRSRSFYARSTLNAKGQVSFGLRHIHALNRYSNHDDITHTVRMMQYIFPRQFRLHNVFTSKVDPKETAQPLKDYTLREKEIGYRESMRRSATRIPRRLRGKGVQLVRSLQKRHDRCSYTELLKHYCPVEGIVSPDSKEPVAYATPLCQVSAFCRASIANLIPNEFWGNGEEGLWNKAVIMKNVDRFVQLSRFESFTLHAATQRLKIGHISWLAPPETQGKLSLTDLHKRREIFLEFIFYLFDSLLIPLIRSNFHVTETNQNQNRMFYFRHDVWRALSEPVLSQLKASMFEEVPMVQAKRILDSRTLGFSQLRLLPKTSGFRPIMNLRRRMTKLHNGKAMLGRSINSVMAPVYNVLELERKRRPELVGNSLFSVGDIYAKISSFKASRKFEPGQRFYMVKADARACFDTIPQRKLLHMMKMIPQDDVYRISRHCEVKRTGSHYYLEDNTATDKPSRKFVARAREPTDLTAFDAWVHESAARKKDTVYVDGVVQQSIKTGHALGLLDEHVQRNIVKIGKKMYRQKNGIPQGSILSSLLCNIFYADLERTHLHFLDSDSLLLRLIDDFMLITTSKPHATQFMQTMHSNLHEYGVQINLAKTLANFPLTIADQAIPTSPLHAPFPFCGILIDPVKLDVSKDRARRKQSNLANALTVERSRAPGRAFYRKTMDAFKIQTTTQRKLLFDTRFNGVQCVMSTLYGHLLETAMKCYRYVKTMKRGTRPHVGLIVGTIRDVIKIAQIFTTTRNSANNMVEFECAVTRAEVKYLAIKAFAHVLGRKQTSFPEVLDWLVDEQRAQEKELGRGGTRSRGLVHAVRRGNSVFGGYRY